MNLLNQLSRWTARFKIGAQLLVARSLCIALTAALGGYAIVQLSSVKNASDALKDR